MDKSFNDQELSDIMKEIEALEDDFKVDEAVHETEEAPVMKHHPEEHVVCEKPKAHVIEFAEKPVHKKSTAMSFKVEGQMNMEMQFDVGGKVVCLEISENCFSIQMEGGVTFNIPLTGKKAS